MTRPAVVIEVSSNPRLAQDLAAGGVFVPGCTHRLNEECELVVRGASSELRLVARVVFADEQLGTGFELLTLDADTKVQLASVIGAPVDLPVRRPTPTHLNPAPPPPSRRAKPVRPTHAGPESEPVLEATSEATSEATKTEPFELEPATEEDALLELAPRDEATGSDELAPEVEAAIHQSSGDPKLARHVHERLRGLTLVQQLKLAQTGEGHERIVLERMYGKTVWEPLLRNPRITGPEVARIARMGALPRPMIEVIVGNGGWLQIPEVRRALLTNPRLGIDQITKVLRLTPKHELKLVPQQTAYSHAVRDVARRLLREAE